jgi:hypothetical protein
MKMTTEITYKKEYSANGVKIEDGCTFEYKKGAKRPNGKAGKRYAIYEKAKSLVEYQKLFHEKMATEAKYMWADLRYDETMGLLTIKDAKGKVISLGAEAKKKAAEAKAKAA